MPKRNKISKRKNSHWVIKFIILLLIVILASFSYLSLKNKYQNILKAEKPVTPRLNLPGAYKGNLPCADCPGIKETITLTATDSAQSTGSYLMEDLYLERNPKPNQTIGLWEIVNSNILKLNPKITSPQPQYFLVLENGNLQMLDINMQKIDSPFNQILVKQK